MIGKKLTVVKLNPQKQEVWHYDGKILSFDNEKVVIEAFFNRDDFLFNGMMLKKNDRFLETYYFSRWYNIFEIYDRDNAELKGWYCNVTKPAQLTNGRLSYVDLALDLLVFADGQQYILDEDEFEALNLDQVTRENALSGLAELQKYFTERE